MKAFFVISGSLISLDEDGTGHCDVHDSIAPTRSHYAAHGVDADCVDSLFG